MRDKNTAYFHAIANQRKRKKRIVSLEGPSGLTQDNGEMLQIFIKNFLVKKRNLTYIWNVVFGV